MRRTNIRGHALRSEGKAYVRYGQDWVRQSWVNGPDHIGRGLCECGATSEVERSNGARQRWHAAHKAEVQAQP